MFLVFRNIDREFKLPKKFQVCPRCESINIKFSSKLDFWLTPKRYVCNDCGYVGTLVLELEKVEKKFLPDD